MAFLTARGFASWPLLALALVFGALTLAGWGAGELLESHRNSLDRSLLLGVAARPTPEWAPWVRLLTDLGSARVLGPVAISAVAIFGWKGRRGDALLVAVAALGTFALLELVKDLVDRPRPTTLHLTVVHTNSFPSGHSGDALAVYGAIAIVAARTVGTTTSRAAIWTAAALLALLVGWSRVYLGVHYLSDVVGGYVLAAVWLGVTRALSGPLGRRQGGDQRGLTALHGLSREMTRSSSRHEDPGPSSQLRGR